MAVTPNNLNYFQLDENSRKLLNQDTYLARFLAYEDLSQFSTVQIPGDDGRLNEYRVHRLDSNHGGLIGHVLVPTQNTSGDSHDIKIIFQGTYCKAAVARDVTERGGAGAESFAGARNHLLAQVNQIIKEFRASPDFLGKPICVEIDGHSLAGADSQNKMVAMMDGCAQNNGLSVPPHLAIPAENRDQFRHIQELSITTFNSAGVPQTVADRSEMLAGVLAEQRHRPGTHVPSIEGNFVQTGGDGVQATGKAHILSNVPVHRATIRVLKAHIGHEHRNVFTVPRALLALGVGAAVAGPVGVLAAGATVAGSALWGAVDTFFAHTTDPRTRRNATYEVMSNTTADGLPDREGQRRVHAELSKKSAALNTLQAGVLTLGNGLSSLASAASNGLCNAFNYVTSGFSSGTENTASTPSKPVPPLVFSTPSVPTTPVAPAPAPRSGWFSRWF